MVRHAAILVCLAVILSLFLATGIAWDMTARASTSILEFSGIGTQYVGDQYLMYVRLMDGSVVGFQIQLECSGLITLLVFTFVSAFTVGLLKGSLRNKLVWFLLSAGMGFVWNISRLAAVIAVAYNFGITAFSFVHFILAPSVDFLWIVSAWGIGMSWLKKEAQQ